MSPRETIPPPMVPRRAKAGFADDFRRFFVRGLAALMPTLITLWLLIKIWDFLWESLGKVLIRVIRQLWLYFGDGFPPAAYIQRYWRDDQPSFRTKLVGVLLAILLVYIIGVFVGNLIGRTTWRLAEMFVMRIPLVRAIYPAVKQVTDFVLADRGHSQFAGSRVVAVEPHEKGIWSIGLVTGPAGLKPLNDAVGREMVTVFVPSSPTAFSGYVLVVPRESVIELPLDVEEAMRLLISGGVVSPKLEKASGLSVRASEQVQTPVPDTAIRRHADADKADVPFPASPRPRVPASGLTET